MVWAAPLWWNFLSLCWVQDSEADHPNGFNGEHTETLLDLVSKGCFPGCEHGPWSAHYLGSLFNFCGMWIQSVISQGGIWMEGSQLHFFLFCDQSCWQLRRWWHSWRGRSSQSGSIRLCFALPAGNGSEGRGRLPAPLSLPARLTAPSPLQLCHCQETSVMKNWSGWMQGYGQDFKEGTLKVLKIYQTWMFWINK